MKLHHIVWLVITSAQIMLIGIVCAVALAGLGVAGWALIEAIKFIVK